MRIGYISDLRFDLSPDAGVGYCQSLPASTFDALICTGNLTTEDKIQEAVFNIGRAIYPRPFFFTPSWLEGFHFPDRIQFLADTAYDANLHVGNFNESYGSVQIAGGRNYPYPAAGALAGRGIFKNVTSLTTYEDSRVAYFAAIDRLYWHAPKRILVTPFPPTKALVKTPPDLHQGGIGVDGYDLRFWGHRFKLKYWISGMLETDSTAYTASVRGHSMPYLQDPKELIQKPKLRWITFQN